MRVQRTPIVRELPIKQENPEQSDRWIYILMIIVLVIVNLI
ncbi:hypothetical protein SDC9_164965 [bioreactor metagenome]|uniref:Uncharacterized protein n=1 Tax=bioreactor metagenome TaxID=1076179 RepID=A0A645FVA3_9ZZZZ